MKNTLHSMAYMFLTTLFFTSLVSAVKLTQEDRILKNQQADLQKTILKVLGIPVHKNISIEEMSRLFGRRVETIKVQEKNFYMGYEEDGETIKGYAFPVGGPGFWGPIYGMVAVDPKASKVLGMAFYRHSETPGLGGRLTEKWFTEQFGGLSLYRVEGEKNFFYLTPENIGKPENQLDAITGATRTSHAVELFLNQELDRFLNNFWESVSKAPIPFN